MESFIIQDFKLFAPVRLGEKDTWAHLDTGASGSMIASLMGKRILAMFRFRLNNVLGDESILCLVRTPC